MAQFEKLITPTCMIKTGSVLALVCATTWLPKWSKNVDWDQMSQCKSKVLKHFGTCLMRGSEGIEGMLTGVSRFDFTHFSLKGMKFELLFEIFSCEMQLLKWPPSKENRTDHEI